MKTNLKSCKTCLDVKYYILKSVGSCLQLNTVVLVALQLLLSTQTSKHATIYIYSKIWLYKFIYMSCTFSTLRYFIWKTSFLGIESIEREVTKCFEDNGD